MLRVGKIFGWRTKAVTDVVKITQVAPLYESVPPKS